MKILATFKNHLLSGATDCTRIHHAGEIYERQEQAGTVQWYWNTKGKWKKVDRPELEKDYLAAVAAGQQGTKLDPQAGIKAEWEKKFFPLFGRTIAGIRYMQPDEMKACGWDRAPLVIILDDNTILWASADDEGTDAGAMYFQEGKKTKGIPDGAPVI